MSLVSRLLSGTRVSDHEIDVCVSADGVDSGDWAIGADPNYTHESVLADMTGWFEGSKSPGINSLEHEIKDTEVDAFIAAFPIGRSNGWNIMAIPDAFNQPWYSNSDSNSASVTSRSIGEGIFTGSGASTSSSSASNASTTSASASSSSSASPTTSASATSTSQSAGASSDAANAPTASPSNGAAQLVVGTGSLWALVTLISALVM